MTDSEKLDLLLTKVQGMETEMKGMKKKLDKLSLGQLEIRKEIIMLNRKISDTYDVALDALGTSTENREWLEKGTWYNCIKIYHDKRCKVSFIQDFTPFMHTNVQRKYAAKVPLLVFDTVRSHKCAACL